MKQANQPNAHTTDREFNIHQPPMTTDTAIQERNGPTERKSEVKEIDKDRNVQNEKQKEI